MKNLKLLTWLAVVLLPVSAAQAADAYDDGGGDEERFSLRIMGGLNLQNHSVTSADTTRFSASLPLSTGWVAGGEFRYHKRESSNSLRVRYRHTDASYTGLSSAVSPSSVSDKREDIQVALFTTPFGDSKFFQHLKLGIGVFVLYRSATETTPNAVLTSSMTEGFTLNASYGRRVNDDLNWEANVSLGLPVAFREYFQRTGYYSNAQLFRANVSLAYSISRFVELAIAPELRMDRFAFEDNGARATQGAVDGGMDLMVPLELRVRF